MRGYRDHIVTLSNTRITIRNNDFIISDNASNQTNFIPFFNPEVTGRNKHFVSPLHGADQYFGAKLSTGGNQGFAYGQAAFFHDNRNKAYSSLAKRSIWSTEGKLIKLNISLAVSFSGFRIIEILSSSFISRICFL